MSKRETKAKKFLFRILPTAIIIIFSIMNYSRIKASFYHRELLPYIEINGVDYGRFNFVEGVLDPSGNEIGYRNFSKVALGRQFVTDPSLSFWAKQNFENNTLPQDISLIYKTKDGSVVSSYTLRLCKPLSWTLEVADEASGGYKEVIDLAVREIKVNSPKG